MKFKIGDRVAIYGGSCAKSVGNAGRLTGAVVGTMYDGRINVLMDGETGTGNTFHSKQCRRLKQKVRKDSIWIEKGGLSTTEGKLDQRVAFHWQKSLVESFQEYRPVTRNPPSAPSQTPKEKC